MSIKYTAIEDQLLMLLDALQAEEDIIVRLRNIKQIEKKAIQTLRTLKRETAFKARETYRSEDIAQAIGSDRKDVDYWITCYYTEKGIPKPKRAPKQDLSHYLDLSGG